MQLRCPTCARPLDMGDQPAGSRVRCPHCRTTFRVPEIGGGDEELYEGTVSTVRETFKGTLLIVFLASFVLLSVAGIILVVKIRNNPEPARRALGDYAEFFSNMTTIAGAAILVILAVAYALLALFMTAWVARDAYNRNLSGLGWAVFYLAWHIGVGYPLIPFVFLSPYALVGLLASWSGLIIYLMARRPGKLVSCGHCRNSRLEYVTICPHCGVACNPANDCV